MRLRQAGGNKQGVVLGKSSEGEFQECPSASSAAEKSKQSEDGEGTTGSGHVEVIYFLSKAISLEMDHL